ncbi:MAG: hypothetical protein BWY23_01274 [Spirochaetes bacterium ADurb.Bin218]|jgi:hypothetical protein|nr:hypothetical protein [Spirochaetota bacterium]OQA98017.1 MAG: hypothetical protein BWY23_01274 [Spirochaetes bacterium ADurb.Bin218]HOQ12780.1 hypothetical protein [Spirochaetota bacterium]HOV07537.1 hypothetical protein [Spirochaetota bacterium]HPX90532.1 hypothetical protein [Spirochaetota bacterium]
MKVNLYKYLIFSGLLLFTACSKTPESILSPSIKIQLDKATGSYILLFTAGIKNENDSVVFSNFNGKVKIIDNNKRQIISIPFELPVILPFETGIIKNTVTLSESEANEISKFLNIDLNLLNPESEEGTKFLDDSNVSLEIKGFEKEDIIKFLKKKVK